VRLFVSLRPPPEALDHLAAACAGLRTTRAEQWHVTLAFLGEVPDAALLHEPLARAAAAAGPLALRLHGSGSFAGAYWVGLAGDLEALHALAYAVARAAREAGVPLERRRYRPHLTVSRRARRPAARLRGAAVDGRRARAGAQRRRERVVHRVLAVHRLG
jgi:2'-5' RNA ligase